MSYTEQTRKEIIEAYVYLRENNHSIPSDTLEFIKDSSLKALEAIETDTVEDLSYSGIVNLVNHNHDTAKELLIQIAKEKEVIDVNLQDLEIKLQQLKTRQLQLKKGALLVLRHINKETPLTVLQDGCVVMISDENITIDRNII